MEQLVENPIDTTINGIIDIISKIKHIELISAEWKNRIEAVHPELNAFALATIEVTKDNTTDTFLTFEYGADKTHYTKLVTVKYLFTNPINNKDVFVTKDLIEFKKPINSILNIEVRKPNSEENAIFKDRHPVHIGGFQAHLSFILLLEEQSFFVGYKKMNSPRSIYFPLFEKVNPALLSNVNMDELIIGGWSEWMDVDAKESNKFQDIFPYKMGVVFTPTKYRTQIVSGTNYEVQGTIAPIYMPLLTKHVTLSFYEANDGTISNVKVNY